MKKAVVILISFLTFAFFGGRVVDAAESYAEEHVYSEWILVREPTCIRTGERYQECLNHGGRIIEELPLTKHQYEVIHTEATCTEEGGSIYTCSVCGDTYEEVLGEPLGHDYQCEITMEAKCQMEGVMTYRCSRCGDDYQKTIPELSHEYGEWIIEKEPEAGIEGSRYRACRYCGESIRESIPALPLPAPETGGIKLIHLIIGGIDVGIFGLFSIFIFPDLFLILWDRKNRKIWKEQRKNLRKRNKGGDGCGFH